MTDRNETLADIVADIRERAENVKRHGDEHPTSGEAIGNLLLSIADRIEAEAKRAWNEIDTALAFTEIYECEITDVRAAMNKTIGDYYE